MGWETLYKMTLRNALNASLDVDPRECEERPALPEDADVLRDEGVDALGELWVEIQ